MSSFLQDSISPNKCIWRQDHGKYQIWKSGEWQTVSNFLFKINQHGYDPLLKETYYLLHCKGISMPFEFSVPITPSMLGNMKMFYAAYQKYAVSSALFYKETADKVQLLQDIYKKVMVYASLEEEIKQEVLLVSAIGFIYSQNDESNYFVCGPTCLLVAKTKHVPVFNGDMPLYKWIGPKDQKKLAINAEENPAELMYKFLTEAQNCYKENFPLLLATLGSMIPFMNREELYEDGVRFGAVHYLGPDGAGKSSTREIVQSVLPNVKNNGKMKPDEMNMVTQSRLAKRLENGPPFYLDPSPEEDKLKGFESLMDAYYGGQQVETTQTADRAGKTPLAGWFIVWKNEMERLEKLCKTTKTKGLFLYFEKEELTEEEKSARKITKQKLVHENVGAYTGAFMVFLKKLKIKKFRKKADLYRDKIIERFHASDRAQMNDRTVVPYGLALAGIDFIAKILPCSKEEKEKYLDDVLEHFVKKDIPKLLKYTETSPTMSVLKQENVTRLLKFVQDSSMKVFFRHVSFQNDAVFFSNTLKNLPHCVNLPIIFGKDCPKKRQYFLSEKSGRYEYFQFKNAQNEPLYGKAPSKRQAFMVSEKTLKKTCPEVRKSILEKMISIEVREKKIKKLSEKIKAVYRAKYENTSLEDLSSESDNENFPRDEDCDHEESNGWTAVKKMKVQKVHELSSKLDEDQLDVIILTLEGMLDGKTDLEDNISQGAETNFEAEDNNSHAADTSTESLLVTNAEESNESTLMVLQNDSDALEESNNSATVTNNNVDPANVTNSAPQESVGQHSSLADAQKLRSKNPVEKDSPDETIRSLRVRPRKNIDYRALNTIGSQKKTNSAKKKVGKNQHSMTNQRRQLKRKCVKDSDALRKKRRM